MLVCGCGSFGSADDAADSPPDGASTELDADATDAGDERAVRDASSEADGAPNCPYARCIDFEAGFAGLAITGSPSIEKVTPLKGLVSMAVKGATSYVSSDLAGAADVWISFYVRSGQVQSSTPLLLTSGASPVLAVRTSGLSIYAEGNGLMNATISSTFTPGSTYRVAIHTRAVAGSVEVEGWIAVGDAAFGARAFAGLVSGASGPDQLRIGAADAAAADLVIDDIVVSTTGLPGPT